MKAIDEAGFERRVRETQNAVYRAAYTILRNEHDAQDVAQETFARVHRNLHTLREAGSFRPWVAAIGRRLAFNRLRSNARARARDAAYVFGEPLSVDVEGLAADRIFIEQVYREIQLLPPKLRDVMLLCAIEGLNHVDVAQVLGIPEGTVRSRLHLARKRLLKAVDR